MAGIEVLTVAPINPQSPPEQNSRRKPSIAAIRYSPVSPAKPPGPPPIQTTTTVLSTPNEASSSQRNESISGISPTTTRAPPAEQVPLPPSPQPEAAPEPEDVKKDVENGTNTNKPTLSPQPKAAGPSPYPRPAPAFHKPMSSMSAIPAPAFHKPMSSMSAIDTMKPTASAFSSSIQFSNPFPAALDLSNPPGYTQNSSASFSDRIYLTNDDFTNASTSNTANFGTYLRKSVGQGILTGDMDNDSAIIHAIGHRASESSASGAGAWDRAMSWATGLGKKLSQTEEYLWNFASGEK